MNFSAARDAPPARPSFCASLRDLEAPQTRVGSKRLAEDRLGAFGGHLLDVHAALAEAMSTGPAAARSTTIPRYSSRAMLQPCFDQHAAHHLPFRSRSGP